MTSEAGANSQTRFPGGWFSLILGIYFPTKIDGCMSLNAVKVSRASINSADCVAIGGQLNSESRCELDWCKSETFKSGALYFR